MCLCVCVHVCAVDDVVDKSDDNEETDTDTENDTENEDAEKDQLNLVKLKHYITLHTFPLSFFKINNSVFMQVYQ